MGNDLENKFRTRKKQHFVALEESYLKLVDAAYDKEYASHAYCKTLFDPILRWKDDSSYFKRILGIIVHHSKLNPNNVMNEVIENLESIKDEYYEMLEILDDYNNRVELDLYFVELGETELIDHIAQFMAAIDLSKKYDPKSIEPDSLGKPNKKKSKSFTRNQQLLALYYTLKELGIEPRRTTDMTKYTRFIHLLAGVDFDKVENDIFYSKVKNLPNILTDQNLKKELEFIRSYFVQIGANSIVDDIDTEINGCDN